MSKITVTNNADISTLCSILESLNDKTVNISIYTALQPIDIVLDKFLFLKNDFYMSFRDVFSDGGDFLIYKESISAIEVVENMDTYKFVRIQIVEDIFVTVMDIICEY